MSERKPSYNALLRKIERLEALVQEAHHEQQKARHAYTDQLHELVDLKMRNEQAQRLLSGQDA